MFDISLYYAEVIDNDDQNSDDKKKLGRVKVKVLPEMKEIKDSFLPWARPFLTTGMSKEQFGWHVPEKGEKVWVVSFDNQFKVLFYLSGVLIDGLLDIDSIASDLGGIEELSEQTYPQPVKFQKYPDGTITFHNSETGETGIYHSSGAYTVFDSDGNYTLNSAGGKVTFKNDLANLRVVIENMRKVIENIITPGNLTGNMGAPILYTKASADLPKIKVETKTDLDNLMESE